MTQRSDKFRPSSSSPAERLQSVAARYQSPQASSLASSKKMALTQPDEAAEGQDTQPANESDQIARIHAILFLAREPISSRKLAQYANLADGTAARTLVRRLNQDFDQNSRAFRVEEIAGGFQLTTRSKFAKWLRRLNHVPKSLRLSPPALETLAVVAYRQPVIRANIEAIRGVSCAEILSQLIQRDLVKVSGRSEDLGRPYLYSTTKYFLRIFGLRSLEDLPRAEAWLTQTEAASEDCEPLD